MYPNLETTAKSRTSSKGKLRVVERSIRMLHSVVRDEVRRSTMAVLVEIVCSVSQEEFAQVAVEAFCRATGGLLIGRPVIEVTHKALLMVRVPPAGSVSKDATPLSQARQSPVIESFRYVTY